jgi:asparagine synthase (glutamine-hydrolysing)
MIKVNIKEEYFWQKQSLDNLNLWFKGYIHNKTIEQLLIDFQALELSSLENYLLELDGHFAIVVQKDCWTIMAVDKIRSIPLFYTRKTINSHALSLVKSSNLTQLNQDAVLSLKMSGYTINEDTLYQGLNGLIAGQFVVFEKDKVVKKHYYQYQPWRTLEKDNYKELL